MLSLIGIFVITSSACVPTIEKGNPLTMEYLIKTEKCSSKLVRISSSSATAHCEIARPVCDWLGHQWKFFDYCADMKGRKCFNGLCSEYAIYVPGCDDGQPAPKIEQCLFCDKKRVMKEVWEDVE